MSKGVRAASEGRALDPAANEERSDRRSTVTVDVGGVPVGSAHPIVVQSMTNTDTADVASTVAQVKALADAGSELVRITVNTAEAATAVPMIRAGLDAPVGLGQHVVRLAHPGRRTEVDP